MSRGNRSLAAVAAVFAFGLVACGALGIQGEGPAKSETRTVAPFTRIDVSGGIHVTVHIGTPPSLAVSAQEKVLPVIATDVEAGTLRIHGTKSFIASAPVEVTVVTAALDGVTLSGGSTVVADGLAADTLDIAISGGSNVTATGTAGKVTLDGSGGSKVTLQELSAASVAVELSGGSNAMIRASDAVTGDVSGGSHLTVFGDAKTTVDTSTGSDVTHQ